MKTFILGVGAQKGGTSWLHRQLTKNNTIDLGFRKEYHVFDAIEGNSGLREKKIQRILRSNSKGRLGLNHGQSIKSNRAFATLELSFIDNVDNYFNYFDYLYLRSENILAVGDITPSYAILKPGTFQMIKKGLNNRGFDIKLFFLMRDPVERLWSAARMAERDMSEEKSRHFDVKKFLSSSKSGHNVRSQYEKTISVLENVFDSRDIFYGFYEDMFCQDYNSKISQFLDMPLEPFDVNQVINASPKSVPLPEGLYKELALKFEATYEYIRTKFGESMTKRWQGYQAF